jgi:tetratricopeptide (TPR) repeat protein
VDKPGPEIFSRRTAPETIDTMTEGNKKYSATSKLRNSFLLFGTEPLKRARHVHRSRLLKGLSFSLLSFTLVASSLPAGNIPVVRIIIVNSQSEAENILAEINKGASFALLAKERSADAKSRDRYGELEPAAFESLDKPLKETALRLGDGEVSGVITLGDNRRALVLAVDMTYYRKGAKAFRSKDFKTAEINFLKHIELNPDAVKARVMLGQIQEAAKELRKAEANYRDAMRFDPRCEEAYERLGELYLRKGQFQQAKALYDEGLYHIPDSKSLKADIEKVKVRISPVKSETQKSEITKSEPLMDEVPKGATPNSKGQKVEIPKGEMPGGDIPKDKASKSEPSKTGTSIITQDKKMHLRIIVTGSESDAEDILSQVKKGKSFALLAKEKSTDENTRQVYGYLGEVGVNSLDASLRESSLALKEGQTSGIIRMDQDRYALVQITNMSLYREGEKAFIVGDLVTAEEKLRNYVESNPDAVKARTMLGKIYEGKKEFSKAIEMYKKAISFSPKTVLVYERLARVYLFLGEYQKARDVYIEGLRQIPSSPMLEEGIEMADMLLIGEGQRMP